MANARVMIAEDQAIVARDMEKDLKRLGYDVPAIVATGEEAVQQAAETRPNLVLMDIEIQGEIDSVEAAKLIRARFGIPVIYLTAYSDDETLQRAKVTEPLGYILKPFETRELYSAIEIALYKHEMEQQLKQSKERYRQLFEQMHTVLQHMPVMVDALYRNTSRLLVGIRGPLVWMLPSESTQRERCGHYPHGTKPSWTLFQTSLWKWTMTKSTPGQTRRD